MFATQDLGGSVTLSSSVTGRLLKKFVVPKRSVMDVGFGGGASASGLGYVTLSRDGKMIAAVIPFSDTLKIWDVEGGRELASLKAPMLIFGANVRIGFSETADSLAIISLAGRKEELTIWETTSWKRRSTFDLSTPTLRNGSCSSRNVGVWSSDRKKRVRVRFVMERPILNHFPDFIQKILFHVSGLSCSMFYEVNIEEKDSGRLLTSLRLPPTSEPVELSLSDNERILATATVDGDVILWDLPED